MNEIKRSTLEWAGHDCKIRNSTIQRAVQENPRDKKWLGRSMLRWEDDIGKDFLIS